MNTSLDPGAAKTCTKVSQGSLNSLTVPTFSSGKQLQPAKSNFALV